MTTRNASDTAWKEILDAYFKDFVHYCLPGLSKLIDWEKKWVSLDKELQTIAKGNNIGNRLLDKLFKVYLTNGQEQWILIHIEIQGKKDEDFAKRMFIYGYRIYDKYQQPVVSCAILTDANKQWRPAFYKVGLAESYLSSEFLVVKLIDYQNNKEELELSNNPFACVILVQLEALNSIRKPPEQKKAIKFALTRRLYDKGYNKVKIANLYQFIDWVIGLPKPLELEYINDVHQLEEDKKMAYITSAERYKKEIAMMIGLKEGKKEGLKEGREEGREKTQIEIAKKLLVAGVKPTIIEQTTGVSLETIKE